MQSQVPFFPSGLCQFPTAPSSFFQNQVQVQALSPIFPMIPSASNHQQVPTIFLSPSNQTLITSPGQMNIMYLLQQQQQQQQLQFQQQQQNFEQILQFQSQLLSMQQIQKIQQNSSENQSHLTEFPKMSANSLINQQSIEFPPSSSSQIQGNLDTYNNLQCKDNKMNNSVQSSTTLIDNSNKNIFESEKDKKFIQIIQKKKNDMNINSEQTNHSRYLTKGNNQTLPEPNNQQLDSVFEKINNNNPLISQSSSDPSEEISDITHSDNSDDKTQNKSSKKSKNDKLQENSGSQDGQAPIRNNEDPYRTYKYPSQIQNQLRKQVLKRFFKSVPAYLDTFQKSASHSFPNLDKAALKALCKYWSQFDNPTRRLQLKNDEYINLCKRLEVNPEIKPLGQKCLKEIFGKDNQFSYNLRFLYQEFNKEANAFANRKKNLGMQHKWVQASNRIYRDIFED